MNKEPETLPLPLTKSLPIPTWWTPEESFAVFEWVTDLQDAIWRCYNMKLFEKYNEQCKQIPYICSEDNGSSASTKPPRIPTWWTPEEALAVFALVSDLRDAIWKCYQMNLVDEYRTQRTQVPDACIKGTDDSAF